MSEERIDKITQDLFEKTGRDKPSDSFTANVMASISDSKEAIRPTPLISVKGWGLIAASIAALIALALALPSSGVPSAIDSLPLLDKSSDFLSYMLGNIGSLVTGASIPNTAWAVVAGIVLFFGLDQLLKKSWNVSASML